MITTGQALKIINRHQPPPLSIQMNPSDAAGKVLSDTVISPEPLPRFTNSAMDGFAVRWDDFDRMEEGGTRSLSIIGESRAGEPFPSTVGKGEAVRINTGAILPTGADTVIAVEEVQELEDSIIVRLPAARGQSIRFEGEEIGAGDILLESGTTLTPPSLGLIVSAGVKTVQVYQPPETAIIVTGNELVDPDEEIVPWQIRDSNRIMLSTAVSQSGGVVTFSRRCGDRMDETREAIRGAVEKAGIILVSGGVSVGPHDLVRDAAKEEGFEQLFWKVLQKPGKPLFFARKSERLLFGLPGNPVSALNCYTYYVHPLLQKMQGSEFNWVIESGIMERSVENRGERSRYLRVEIIDRGSETPIVSPLEKQGSHMLTSLALAHGFILMKANQQIQKEEMVEVHLYPWRK